MEKSKKIIRFLFVAFAFMIASPANAQEIKGDTIFVNAEAEILVRFPTMPTYFNTVPSNAPYNFKTAGNGFTVIAKSENTKSVPLTVSEGGRTHKFILAFKKNINYNNDAELDYDFSTVKKIENHIRENQLLRKKEESAATVEAAPEQKKPANTDVAQINKKSVTTSPDTKVSTKNNTDAGDESNLKYVKLTTEAKVELDAKNYDVARTKYSQALSLRPGDLYATHQVAVIDKIIEGENNKKDQEKLKNLYAGYMKSGKDALAQNKLGDARLAFQQALLIVTNDQEASNFLKQIDEKENLLKKAETLEANYAAAVREADQYFQKGDYTSAKTQYEKALSLVDRPLPHDQINNIAKIIAKNKEKEELANQKMTAQLEEDKKKKAAEELENNYKEIILSADELYQAGKYAKAREQYTKANALINRPWPTAQIANIDQVVKDIANKERDETKRLEELAATEKKIQANKLLEDRYQNAINIANKLYSDKDYKKAQAAYQNAMAIIQKDWPQTQIKNISQLLANEEIENRKKIEEGKITANYLQIIKKADAEFTTRNFVNSQKLYMDALAIKPNEEYPKDRLKTIQFTLDEVVRKEKIRKDSLEAVAQSKAKYEMAISSAKAYHLKGDLDMARSSYQEALNLRPTAKDVQLQLTNIESKIEANRKEKEANEKYDQIISLADNALIAKSLDDALDKYNQAMELKPTEYYPQAQIKYIHAEKIYLQKQKGEDSINTEVKSEIEFRKIIDVADQAIKDKKYDVASEEYKKALAILPDNKYALQRLKIAEHQYNIQNSIRDSSSFEPTDVELRKIIHSKFKTQTEADGYSMQEVAKKYPKINFAVKPPDQLMAPTPANPKDNFRLYNDLLALQPKISLSSSSEGINIIATRIAFEDSLVYLRVLVQNDSKDDFLTGPMMVTWTRRSGNIIKLYPVYLFPDYFPLLKPGNQATVIYAFKSYVVSNDESIKFNMQDRLHKINLEITIPGSIYNSQNYVRYY